MNLKLSIVIPTYNEINNEFFKKTIQTYSQNEQCRIYVVDRFSTDGTLDFLSAYNVNVITTKSNSRASRINIGLDAAETDLVLLNHPRSFIEQNGVSYLINNSTSLVWGAFTHKFDCSHPILKFTSWYSNYIRGDFRQIYYLDHCIYLNKSKVNFAHMVDVDIFEDTLFCKYLAKISKGKRVPFFSMTSAVRFIKNGILRQATLNQIMKLGHMLNIPHKYMNRIYEKGLNLNSKY